MSDQVNPEPLHKSIQEDEDKNSGIQSFETLRAAQGDGQSCVNCQQRFRIGVAVGIFISMVIALTILVLDISRGAL